MLGLVYGCDDIPNPFVDYYEKAQQAREAGDLEAAVKWYTKAAEQGDVKGQYILALIYYSGHGVAEDHKKALYWYTKAAEQGYTEAQLIVAVMYRHGQGTPKDNKLAVYWYTKAAELGQAEAQSLLGFMYYHGEGVPKDIIKAHMWFNISASNGDLNGKSGKEIAEQEMLYSQIDKAEKMAKEWVAKNYKGC